MAKRKLTLSVNEELLEEVKLFAQSSGRSLSSIVEEYFEYLAMVLWIDSLAKELGLDELGPSTEEEIRRTRPHGMDAARVVREIRDGRVRMLSP